MSFKTGCGRSLTSATIESAARIPGIAASQKIEIEAHGGRRAARREADDRQRDQRSGDRAGGVGGFVETERAPPRRGGNRVGQERVMQRRSQAPPRPSEGANHKNPRPPGEKPIKAGRHAGEKVAARRPGLAALDPVAELPAEELGEARQRVGDAFNPAKRYGRRPDRRKKQRQDRCPRFVAEVRQEPVDREADDVPVEPTIRAGRLLRVHEQFLNLNPIAGSTAFARLSVPPKATGC